MVRDREREGFYKVNRKKEYAMGKKMLGLLLAVGLVIPAGLASAEDAVIATGKKVKFDYTLTVGTETVETTTGKEPLAYTQGQGQLIPGLEKALEGMKVGDAKTVVVKPEEGYGLSRPEAVREFPIEKFPQGMTPAVGMILEMQDESGNSYPATVSEVNEKTVKLDFNHPLAGKELKFDVKIVSIE